MIHHRTVTWKLYHFINQCYPDKFKFLKCQHLSCKCWHFSHWQMGYISPPFECEKACDCRDKLSTAELIYGLHAQILRRQTASVLFSWSNKAVWEKSDYPKASMLWESPSKPHGKEVWEKGTRGGKQGEKDREIPQGTPFQLPQVPRPPWSRAQCPWCDVTTTSWDLFIITWWFM